MVYPSIASVELHFLSVPASNLIDDAFGMASLTVSSKGRVKTIIMSL
jgi:hypothetical protein